MSGFFAMPPEAWASAREALPRPWREEWAMADLRYWQDRLRVDPAVQRMPSRRALEAAWGWGSTRVRRLVADEDAWADPFFRPTPNPATTQRQPTPVRSKAGNRRRTTQWQPRPDPPPTHAHAGANSVRVHRAQDTTTPPPTAPRTGGLWAEVLAERIVEVVEAMAVPEAAPVEVPGPGADPASLAKWPEAVAALGAIARPWLLPCKVHLEDAQLVVVTPNTPIRDWVVEHYLPRLRALLGVAITVTAAEVPTPWQRLAEGDAEVEAEVRARIGPLWMPRRERTWLRAIAMALQHQESAALQRLQEDLQHPVCEGQVLLRGAGVIR